VSAARTLEVPATAAGTRLDAFLGQELSITRGYARRMLLRDRVTLAGRPARKGALLRAGDRVDVGPFRHPSEGLLPAPELRLPILREADGLLAIDKPAGLPTHPLDYDEPESAAQAFLALRPDARHVGHGGLEPGLLHRLDTHTSGVLLFATREDAWRRARDAFETGRAEKHYLARVHGQVAEDRALRLHLGHAGQRMRVVTRGGRPAHTRIRPIDFDGDTTLLEVSIETGVRHQIRATLAHLGHPVVGDRLYGSPEAVPRHLLHAHVLRIDTFEATAPPPPELRTRGHAARGTGRQSPRA